MSAAELDGRLQGSLRVLSGTSKTVESRRRTLPATIDRSHDLLTDAERRVFRRCAVFSGGSDLNAATAVCAGKDLDPDAVMDQVDSLVDKSLLVARPDAVGTRCRQLEPVRQ